MLHCLLCWTSTTSGSSAEKTATSETPHVLYSLIQSGQRCGRIPSRTRRLGNSFYPTAIRLLNQSKKTCTIAQSCFLDLVQAAHCGAVLLLACLDCFYQNHNYHLSIYSFKMNGALVVLSNWQAAM